MINACKLNRRDATKVVRRTELERPWKELLSWSQSNTSATTERRRRQGLSVLVTFYGIMDKSRLDVQLDIV